MEESYRENIKNMVKKIHMGKLGKLKNKIPWPPVFRKNLTPI